jgi:hypothetical protein
LCPDYIEFGKLQVVDLSSGRTYLVRSDGALTVEGVIQSSLINDAEYITSPIVLVIYKFHYEGMDLSVAGTRLEVGARRLQASGRPTFVATWPFAATGPNKPFDQGTADPFGDVGDVETFGAEERL